MKKKNLESCVLVLILCAVVCISGCIFSGTKSQPQQITGNGTITLLAAGSDTYSLVSENGDRYYPLYLPFSFKSDGMAVAYTLRENTSSGGVPGACTPADVIELVALSPPGSLIAATGTVRYVDLEGGFYGITVDKGNKYGTVDFFPINLEDQYKVNNSAVRFTGVPQRDVMTTVMWGIPVQIIEIEKI